MPTHYRSFLLRCWHLRSGEVRFEVRHVQSGHSIRVTRLADAVEWIEICLRGELERATGVTSSIEVCPSEVEDDDEVR